VRPSLWGEDGRDIIVGTTAEQQIRCLAGLSIKTEKVQDVTLFLSTNYTRRPGKKGCCGCRLGSRTPPQGYKGEKFATEDRFRQRREGMSSADSRSVGLLRGVPIRPEKIGVKRKGQQSAPGGELARHRLQQEGNRSAGERLT